MVFPSPIEAARSFAVEARAWDARVVGASSLAHDESAALYDAWERLPYISDPDFLPALRAVVERHGVTQIFTPHAPSRQALEGLLADHLPQVKLRGESPQAVQMGRVRRARAEVEAARPAIEAWTGQPAGIDDGALAAILTQAMAIYGECPKEKVFALAAAMSCAPKGDVVEIGSFFGRTAYVLNRLAAHFGIGPTLAVDPWDMATSVQIESPENIQRLSAAWDWELVFQGFLLNLRGVTSPPFNYLRAPSHLGFDIYAAGGAVESPEFGATELSGQVALLHIDGNHDEAAVAQDFALWSSKLAPGGWIVFDDYEWSQGDGPRVVADRVVADWAGRIARRFTAGGALFIGMKG